MKAGNRRKIPFCSCYLWRHQLVWNTCWWRHRWIFTWKRSL